MSQTPLMKQYWDIKTLHQDKILLFRMGDFFEIFHEDARIAAPIVGIALTQRNKKSQDQTPMCGVPHHSVAGPINKLLKAGLKVAICDQIEDPKFAKGLVRRAVTRILTPGMVYDPDNLNPDIANYLACFEDGTLSCVDTSSGEAFFISRLDLSEAQRFLQLLPIAEMVTTTSAAPLSGAFALTIFDHLDEEPSSLPKSARRLLCYIKSLGGNDTLKTLATFEERSLQKRMVLSSTVARHLELFVDYMGAKDGALLGAIDRTKTSTGTRLLRQWISFPLCELAALTERQQQIQYWIDDLPRLQKIREQLSLMGDLERRMGRLSLGQCNARDIQNLGQGLRLGMQVAQMAGRSFDPAICGLSDEIDQVVCDEPPLQTRQGHMIRRGVSPILDELIELSTNSQSLLAQMEEREKSQTGIASLKIRFNNVFGYYIEITHTHKEKIPGHYMRKQTLANAERYCTDELLELEKKVLSAQSRRADLEYEIFESLRQKLLQSVPVISALAQIAAEIDVVTALAWLAVERNYVCPVFTDGDLCLQASRHPVVERAVKKNFVANDICLTPGGCLLLTGPNMAGKSTLMRQVALTAILAQIGSFVPATRAELPILDAIYTRIGASDQLSQGLSTFMVEMVETAEMVKSATEKSLVILDEVGRGTSTFDGMSLAQSILEYLVTDKQCLTLFATHYHELTAMEATFPRIRNAHMSIVEKRGEIQFLHTLKSGPAQKSYGIQVGRLAGLPEAITKRAAQILHQLENQNQQTKKESLSSQLSFLELNQRKDETELEQVKDTLKKIKSFEVSKRTPLEALIQISEWQNDIDLKI